MTGLTFKHSGKIGDLIYALPTVRALGGGGLRLNLSAFMGFTHQSYLSVLPLLLAQPYISDVSPWQGEDVSHDLDRFRLRHDSCIKNLADAHLEAFGFDERERRQLWITVEGDQGSGHVLFAKNLERTTTPGFWEQAIALYPGAKFIGHQGEYEAFRATYGEVEYLPTVDLLEVARQIKEVTLLVANQSAPLAIAHGIGASVLIDIDPTCPNCCFS